jgi:predicted P-loop ATPase
MNDFSRKVVGHSICEFEESGGINHRSDANRTKKAISEQEDHYHPKFHGHRVVKRSCVFVISVNRMKDTLNDPTGATRFYPVHSTATRKEPIDTEGFSAIYPQLLAQGIKMYDAGETAQLSADEQDLQALETVKMQYVPDEEEWVDMYFESDSNVSDEDGKALTNFQTHVDKGWVHWEDVVVYQRGVNSSAEKKDFSRHKRRINEGIRRWGFTISKAAKGDNGRVVKAYWHHTSGG